MKQKKTEKIEIITCRICGERKPRYRKRHLSCRECNLARGKIWRDNNKERQKVNVKRWREDNLERHKANKKRWTEENPNYNSEYARKNVERMRKHKRNYKIKKRATDPAYRFSERVFKSVREMYKRGGGKKSKTTSESIGYPVYEMFVWAKGEGYNPPHTHIDHKEPVSYFLKKYPDDIHRAIREAWALSNLQILPAAENIRKGDMRYADWLALKEAEVNND